MLDKVFQEAFRVLKPGGRLMVSDMVLLKELPRSIKDSVEAYVGCIAGASMKGDYLKMVEDAGFKSVAVVNENEAREAEKVGLPIFSVRFKL